MVQPFTLMSWVVLTASTYIAVYYMLLYFGSRDRGESPREESDVTIAVPAYNEEKYVYGCLESLTRLDYPAEKLRIIFVDDGSTDGTLDVVKEFARDHPSVQLTMVRHKENRGKAAALNTALQLTETPYFVTMDSDSFADPSALRELLKYAGDNAVVTPAVVPKQSSKRLHRLQAIEYIYGNYLANLLSGFDAQLVAPGPFSLFNAEALREVGGFDESSPTEDLEIVYRLRKAGHSLAMSYRAVVETDAPSSVWGLVKQRKRWHLGFFDTVEKHSGALVQGGEFGRQTSLKLVYFTLSISFVVLAAWGAYRGALPLYTLFRAVGLDLLPYFSGMEFNLDILKFDPQVVFYAAVSTLLTLTFLVLSFRAQERHKPGPVDSIIFLMSYGFALSAATVLAAASWLRRDYRW